MGKKKKEFISLSIMGYKRCTQTFLFNGQLIPVSVDRPTGFGWWPPAKAFRKNQLVARLVGKTGSLEIIEGPLASPAMIADNVLMHMGVEPHFIDRQLWQSLPVNLIAQAGNQLRNASQQIERQHSQFSNEEATTGAFFSRATDLMHGADDWKAELKFIEFSKQSKEGRLVLVLMLLL